MTPRNPSGLRRRTLAKAGLFGAAAAPLLAACGDDADGGDGRLTFAWWGSDPRHAYTQEIIDAFVAENEGITVQGEPADFDGYWDALNISVSGGNAPDVMQQDERYLRDYADKDTLVALEDVGVDLSAIDPVALQTGQIDGKTYGVATGVNALCLLVNPELVEAAGVAMPDDLNWSWEDFVAWTTAISEGGDAFGNSAISFNNESLFNVFARQQGESLYTPEGGLGFSAETMTRWWTMVTDMSEAGAIPQGSQIVEARAAGQDQAPLAAGRAASEFYWTNQVGALQQILGGSLELLRVPGETSGVQPGMFFKSAMYWSISSQNSDAEASAALVNFLLNSDTSLDLTLTDRGLPSNLEQRERILPDLPEEEAVNAAFMEALTPDLGEGPPVPPVGAGEVADIALRVYDPLLFGDATPAETAEQFMAETEAAISR